MTPRRALLLALLLPLAACARDDGTLVVAGTVEIREIRLAPLTDGRLVRLLRDEGDTVRAGDTVALLAQPGLDATIGQRMAQARAADARVAEVDAALADSVRTADELVRVRTLITQGGATQRELEAATSSATAAAARLQAARAARDDAAAAQAAVAVTRAVHDELTLIAPASGVILVRHAEPGEALAAGTPVVTIGLVRSPWIRAYVPQPAIARVRLGQAVRVRVDGYPDSTFAGTISEIAPRAEFTPRTALTERERADLVFAIKVAVDDAGGRLKAGMPVDLLLPLAP